LLLRAGMNALVKLALVPSICAACSGGADDKKTESMAVTDSLTEPETETGAAGAAETAAPSPLTEEELQRLLDALEQEIDSRK
jgi:hypothetical protein